MAPPILSRFRLANGLRVLLLEDHRAPLVAVHVAYAAGAADEPEGCHGLAHLYEHLMYGGSANLRGAYLTHLLDAGAHDLNGRTGLDSTHYFETVHTQALEFALFAEADRMGSLLPALGEDTLERQRKVVLNELRQYRERSDGRAQQLLAELSHAPGHPYRHGIIGSEADLSRITLDQAREFGRRHYHPGNALLALAGDLSEQQARQLCERYFGAIAAAESVTAQAAMPQPAAAARRVVESPAASGFQLYRLWNLPAPASVAEQQSQALLARLVQARLQAKRAPAGIGPELRYRPGRLGAQLELSFRCADAADFDAATRWLDRQWRQLLDAGPNEAEFAQNRQFMAQALAQGLDSRQGLAERMIEIELLTPGQTLAALDAFDVIDRASLQQCAQRWLGAAPFELEYRQPAQRAAASATQKRMPPAIGPAGGHGELPPLQAYRLASGLRLLLARRPNTALLSARLIVAGGGALETPRQMGLAQLSASLLQLAGEHGAALTLSEAAAAQGVDLSTEAQADCIRLAWSSTRAQSLSVLAAADRALMQPGTDEAAFLRLRERQLSAIAGDAARAESATQRVLPALLFGACGRIPRGLRSSLAELGIDDVAAFHRCQYLPQQAVCLLVGDPALEDIGAQPEEPAMASAPAWPADAAWPAWAEPAAAYLIDMPGAAQALVTLAWRLPRSDAAQEVALNALDRLLAAGFSSRLNLRLREDLGWSYGVRSRLGDEAHARRYEIQAWVPAERAADTRAEILRAVDTLGRHGVAPAALQALHRSEALRSAASVERSASLAQRLESRLRLGLLDQPASCWPQQFTDLRAENLRSAAQRLLRLEAAITVVAGDASALRPQFQACGPEPRLIAADAEALYR
jgi:zinc protease